MLSKQQYSWVKIMKAKYNSGPSFRNTGSHAKGKVSGLRSQVQIPVLPLKSCARPFRQDSEPL